MKRTNYVVKYLLVVLLLAAGSLQPTAAQRSNARRKPHRVTRIVSPPTTLMPAPSPSSTSTPLPRAYLDAVKDAEVAEPQEISRQLVAITENEPRLRWRGAGDERRVLVVTWTNYAGYKGQEGKPMTLPTRLPAIWVTAVPELKNFCARLPRTFKNRTLRLEQLLGLPPGKGNTIFVEMWIKPADLFRPSPDPEIVDHEAVLSLSSKYLQVAEAYATWFENNKSTYAGDPPYPWTRLGYTYDWGNRRSEVGLSEFGVVESAETVIESVTPTLNYCRSAKRRRR
ncbi:MAG TPA: hypothetical protein VK363_14705 [Pyrinomonadaceae bacterium]|nr:hypothetical protein [Pyrinomonadaceae bacterium]